MKKYKIVMTLEGTAPNEAKVNTYINAAKALIDGIVVYSCKFEIKNIDVKEVEVPDEW